MAAADLCMFSSTRQATYRRFGITPLDALVSKCFDASGSGLQITGH
jgi:hypothetical protein